MTTRRMLINALQPEETRVAITDDQKLIDFDIEIPSRTQKKSNIYKARISRIEPSLNAVFVDYGGNRHGFMPVKEIAPEYLSKPIEDNSDLKSALSEGQEIIIQINKEERGSKGAAVTSFITLAGCYLVLMPNDDSAGGISRRIEGEERRQLKQKLSNLNSPDNMGVIARTAGLGRTEEELQWDLDALVKLWSAVKTESEKRTAPFLIYQESDVILRSIRDYLKDNILEIIVDDKNTYERVLRYVKQLRPAFSDRVIYYDNQTPIFTKHNIESQIETAYDREITLPSGGSLVIDHTEALTSIDINSAKATKGGNIEETALHTNLEAATEIARQLRLRDLGGLVVIDFIDMSGNDSQRQVEERLNEALTMDRARVQTGRITKFGLLEMSRQRLRPSLGEATSISCPRCLGQGTIRTVDSLSLAIIRLLREQAIKSNANVLEVQVPVEVATFLLNEKRANIETIEQEHHTRIIVIPNPNLETPHYRLKRLTKATNQLSHRAIEPAAESSYTHHRVASAEKPAIREMHHESAPAARKAEPKKHGFFGSISRLCSSLLSSTSSTETASNDQSKQEKPKDKTTAPAKTATNSNTPTNSKARGGNDKSGSRNQTPTKRTISKRKPSSSSTTASGAKTTPTKSNNNSTATNNKKSTGSSNKANTTKKAQNSNKGSNKPSETKKDSQKEGKQPTKNDDQAKKKSATAAPAKTGDNRNNKPSSAKANDNGQQAKTKVQANSQPNYDPKSAVKSVLARHKTGATSSSQIESTTKPLQAQPSLLTPQVIAKHTQVDIAAIKKALAQHNKIAMQQAQTSQQSDPTGQQRKLEWELIKIGEHAPASRHEQQ